MDADQWRWFHDRLGPAPDLDAARVPGVRARQVVDHDRRTPRPGHVAELLRALEVVPAERVTLSTDCGMKPLSRMVAKMKLQSLVAGASIVREEIG